MDPIIKEYKSGKSYKPVGKCIYCGSTENLGNEHIIPYGLNGQWILPKASCKKCAEITKQFEEDVLRNLFLEIRTSLGLKTRNIEHRPTLLPLIVLKEDTEEVLSLPPNEHFTTACLLEYPLPAYIDGRNYKEEVEVIAYSIISFKKSPNDIIEKYNISEIKIKAFLKNAYSFPRLLAKIAYGFTVAQFGLDSLEESFLPKIITGEDKRIMKYVGTCSDEIMKIDGVLHDVMMIANKKREIMVRIKLLSKNAPEYLVVVGVLKEEAYKLHLTKGDSVSLVHCNK
jgi:hypothetical protein